MYIASKERYTTMEYNRCGDSGLMLPKVSLGLWHNFGDTSKFENMRQLCFTAFDNGITQFDLANNYGPEPGSAEINFGRILKEDLGKYRDELIITTKAGDGMWIFFTIIEWIRRPLWKRPWERWPVQCRAEKPCMWDFPITMEKHFHRQRRFCRKCIVLL